MLSSVPRKDLFVGPRERPLPCQQSRAVSFYIIYYYTVTPTYP